MADNNERLMLLANHRLLAAVSRNFVSVKSAEKIKTMLWRK